MQCTFLSIFSGQRQHWVKMCRTSSTLFASYSTRHFPDLQSERKYSELSSTGNFQTTRPYFFSASFRSTQPGAQFDFLGSLPRLRVGNRLLPTISSFCIFHGFYVEREKVWVLWPTRNWGPPFKLPEQTFKLFTLLEIPCLTERKGAREESPVGAAPQCGMALILGPREIKKIRHLLFADPIRTKNGVGVERGRGRGRACCASSFLLSFPFHTKVCEAFERQTLSLSSLSLGRDYTRIMMPMTIETLNFPSLYILFFGL